MVILKEDVTHILHCYASIYMRNRKSQCQDSQTLCSKHYKDIYTMKLLRKLQQS